MKQRHHLQTVLISLRSQVLSGQSSSSLQKRSRLCAWSQFHCTMILCTQNRSYEARTLSVCTALVPCYPVTSRSLVRSVELGDLLEQLVRLVGCEADLGDVVGRVAVLLRVVVTHVRLHRVGAEQRVRHERTRQSARYEGSNLGSSLSPEGQESGVVTREAWKQPAVQVH